MNIILINWNSGENDPFTLMNNNLKVMLEDYGCLVTVLEYDLEFSKKIFSIECERKVHLAITYQGIGSDLKITNEEICFWEYTKIPLLVLHSDHPSHNPINHAIDNRYVLHTYCLWPYNRYSNKNFIRNNPSLFLGTPSFYKENNTTEQKFNRDGDFFVFPKNLDDTKQLLYSYKKINPILYQIMEKLYHAIYDNFIFGDLLELHDVIDSNLDGALFEKLNYSLDRDTNRQLFHGIHSQADKFYRNIKVEVAKHPHERMEVKQMVKLCKEEFDRLMETCPSIPEKIIQDFKVAFKESETFKEVVKPEICDILVSTNEFRNQWFNDENKTKMIDDNLKLHIFIINSLIKFMKVRY